MREVLHKIYSKSHKCSCGSEVVAFERGVGSVRVCLEKTNNYLKGQGWRIVPFFVGGRGYD